MDALIGWKSQFHKYFDSHQLKKVETNFILAGKLGLIHSY